MIWVELVAGLFQSGGWISYRDQIRVLPHLEDCRFLECAEHHDTNCLNKL